MSTTSQKQSLLDAVGQIRSAEQLLLTQSRNTTDPATLIQLNTEYSHLDSYLSQILHAQAISDDAEFDNATAALKQQAATLSADEAAIKKIVGDVATAGKIAGYIAKALQIIASL